MDFLDEKIEEYVNQHSSPEPELLARLNRETHLKILQPRMLSGHLQGRVLSMLMKMIRPQRILEIGTYTGYSALCMAEGLAQAGELHSIDINEELTDFVQKYVNEAGHQDEIKLHVGNALEIIPLLKEDWDVVFIDADKNNYINYYNLLIDKLKSGSYIIADNVLWSGKVIEDYNQQDEDTKTLIDFNKMIQEDERVENVLFPIRDGLMVVRKK
ncbi:MAG: methyltransferase [Flavobacteriales bacterium]|nr:methyltransferase [Flavobacteriales bacterium]|tara:strand:+ start:3427 stop:4068 length:642 start_codon:yes stop_codon:yes gene_type:complete